MISLLATAVVAGSNAKAAEGVGVVIEWLQKTAEQGNAGAQNSLGMMYYDGEVVAKDDAKAVEWFRKAAEQGNAEAQYNLGGAYLYGTGVVKDEAKAIDWFRKAAEQGLSKAQNILKELTNR